VKLLKGNRMKVDWLGDDQCVSRHACTHCLCQPAAVFAKGRKSGECGFDFG
jgi:hypothetical protein